jgi:hypothetical protein
MNDADLVLFTRPACHLCEVAAELLNARGLEWRGQNIERDIDLIRRYGDKVPVLYRPADRAELLWPFDEESLELFVS